MAYRPNRQLRFTADNVTRGEKEAGENPGYFYAPCEVCGKRLNVGNYPPVLESLNTFGVWCSGHKLHG